MRSSSVSLQAALAKWGRRKRMQIKAAVAGRRKQTQESSAEQLDMDTRFSRNGFQ